MDDMETIRQRFEADVNEYLAEMDRAAEDAKKFARANEEAKVATAGMRDKALEAAKALGIMRDEQGKFRDKAGEVIAVAEVEARALKKIRDNALEAAWAQRELDKYQKQGLFARMLGGIQGGISGFFTSQGGGLGSGLMSGWGLMAIVPIVEALLPEVLGLASGFAAAATGAGAFFILAHPAISQLTQDVSALNTAQEGLQKAQNVYALDPTAAHLKAVHAAMVNLKAVQMGMGQDAGSAAGAVLRLRTEYDKLSQAFQPEAFKVISGFLQLAGQLLPDITPFAKTFADSISGLLTRAANFTGSTGFKDWLKQFHGLEGPSIQAIGNGVGQLAVNIGKLLTVMSKEDVVNAINIAFGILNGTVVVVTYMIKRLMDNWDGMSVAAKHTWYDIKRWSDDVTGAFDKVRHWVATMAHDAAVWWDFMRHHAAILAHDIAAHFDEIRHDIAHWADDVRHDVDLVVGWFEQLPGRILGAVKDFPHLLYQAGQWVVQGLINGIKSLGSSAWGAIVDIGHGIVNSFMSATGMGSPSKVMARLGMYLTQGLILGMQSGIPQLSKMSADLANAVKTAVTGGLISSAQGDAMLQWLANGNARLKTLARERQSIVDQINAARKYAASTASSVEGNFTLSGFGTSGLNGGAATVGQIITSLRIDVGLIRKWAHNIHKLAKEGLNRAYLGQLIAMGPIQGAALAEELANAGLGDIKAINSAQYEISQASGQVGKMAANAMYDSGAAAGKGFLSGLEAQKRAITQLMEAVAMAMVATLKRELHISTPGGTAGGYGGSPSVHVSIPVNVQAGTGAAYQSPDFMQYMQRIVQEAVLRYAQMNPHNGLTPGWGHG